MDDIIDDTIAGIVDNMPGQGLGVMGVTGSLRMREEGERERESEGQLRGPLTAPTALATLASPILILSAPSTVATSSCSDDNLDTEFAVDEDEEEKQVGDEVGGE